ncbi:MAG: hypothetical protein N2C14_33015, partial [Planctomycetales bacterium]
LTDLGSRESDARLGPGMQMLQAADSPAEATREIRREAPDDAATAMQLARALEKANVYLLSKLPVSLVEDFEIIPVDHPRELDRLTPRHDSCVVLGNAPCILWDK